MSSKSGNILKKNLFQHCKCSYEGWMIPSPRGWKPHGYGEWRDESRLGETLRGYWDHGKSVGPSISIATLRKNVFLKLHILYGSNHGTGPSISAKRYLI